MASIAAGFRQNRIVAHGILDRLQSFQTRAYAGIAAVYNSIVLIKIVGWAAQKGFHRIARCHTTHKPHRMVAKVE